MSDYKQLVAVAAIVFRNERVLAMRRSQKKDQGAGLWETLSGRVEPGEEPLAAVKREIAEECGLDAVVDERPVTAYAAKRGDVPMTVLVFRATSEHGDVAMSEEHDDFVWCTPNEFRERSTLTRLADAIDLAARLPWPVRR